MELDPLQIESVSFLYLANFSSLRNRQLVPCRAEMRVEGDKLGGVLIHPSSESSSSDLGLLRIDDSKPNPQLKSVSLTPQRTRNEEKTDIPI